MLAPAHTAMMAEWRSLDDLDDIGPAWRDLMTRVAQPNVFYSPGFLRAAAQTFGRDAGAILVWNGSALRGLIPFRLEHRRYGIRWPILVGYTHAFGPLGTPLIDRDATFAVMAAAFDHIAESPDLPKRLLLPLIPEGGPIAAALDATIARMDGAQAQFSRHGRAILAPKGLRAGYLPRAMGKKQHKELARKQRRLADEGVVTFDMTRGWAVDDAVADFLDLEARGWKGVAGTAAFCRPRIRAFMESATEALAADGDARIACLRLDGRPLASGIILFADCGAWFWKVAYDEEFARFSPGVLLTAEITQSLLEDERVAFVDSCATPDHPMIGHLWRERLNLSDRLMTVAPHAGFGLTCKLETARRTIVSAGKSARDRIRQWIK